MATTGYLANMERGPGRHGLANAFFLYVRDPDGHRIELYAATISPSIPTSSRSAGRCAIRAGRRCGARRRRKSWFEEGSVFPGTPVLPPVHDFKPVVAD